MKNYKFFHRNPFYVFSENKFKSFESEWIKIEEVHKGSKITIKASHRRPYAWDGCSPKLTLLDLTIGTPDGRTNQKTGKPITYYASMVHDAIYQHKKSITISRKECDLLFLKMLRKERFFWAKTYYIFVRIFGWMYGKWKK